MNKCELLPKRRDFRGWDLENFKCGLAKLLMKWVRRWIHLRGCLDERTPSQSHTLKSNWASFTHAEDEALTLEKERDSQKMPKILYFKPLYKHTRPQSPNLFLECGEQSHDVGVCCYISSVVLMLPTWFFLQNLSANHGLDTQQRAAWCLTPPASVWSQPRAWSQAQTCLLQYFLSLSVVRRLLTH